MRGIATSSGIGIGRVFLYKEPEIEIIKENIQDIDLEVNRFKQSVNEAIVEIDRLYEFTLKNIGEKEAEIFSAHRMMLEDPEFISAIRNKIKNDKVKSEFAVNEVTDYYVSIFENIDDEYLRARAVDLKDVSKRLLRVLMGVKAMDLSTIDEKSIIVAEDLTPSDTAQMNREMVVGIVTELGGRTSHTSIIARTMEIPAIAGVKGITKLSYFDDHMIINGDSGEIILNPTREEILNHQEKALELAQFKKKLLDIKDNQSLSKDGHRVEITGNIGTPEDIERVLENGGEGVGLYRTEFLYMDRDRLPSEDEQFNAYKIVVEKLGKRTLVIRTLDVGGDKELPYLNLPKEMNPFLGYRAIRLCLDREDIFRVQLRAILRASAFGNVKIMFPMISDLSEVRQAKGIIEEIKIDLRQEEIQFDENIEIGIMVEIPAVAIHSRAFAKEVDFFSIGTNDLIQYTLAVDRGNQDIAYLYNQYHPSVLNLIRMTIENGHKEGIRVGMCGEAAGDRKLLPIFLAMGLDEFSMSPSLILSARDDLKRYSKKEIEHHLDKILSLARAEDVEKYIDGNIL